jgi:8-oxo-dGTP diphosphatase
MPEEKLEKNESEEPSNVVVVLPVNQNGEILMQLRDLNPRIRAPGLWGFFGGGIELGETPLNAAKRELEEELNLPQADLHELSREESIYDLGGIISTAFTLSVSVPARHIIISEGLDFKYVSVREVKKGLVYSGKMCAFFPIVKTYYIPKMIKKCVRFWNYN